MRVVFMTLLTLVFNIAHADSYDSRDDIYDFLVSDVCTTGGAGGAVNPNLLPHQCAKPNRRNIRPDEFLYYRTIAYPDTADAQYAYGKHAWSSYPVVQNGVRRIVLLKDNGSVSPTGSYPTFGVVEGSDGVSFRWMDTASTGNAFMLFTVSPGGGATGVSPQTCSAYDKYDYRRYSAYWVTAPKNANGMALNTMWGHSQQISSIDSNNPTTGHASDVLPSAAQCSSLSYNYVFASAVRTANYRFTNGAYLETIVHQKNSIGNSLNLGPTTSKGMERIYLTREYGVTRWEVWQRNDRADFDAAAATRTASAMSAATAPNGHVTCSPTFDNQSVNKSGVNFITSAVGKDSIGYFQRYQDKSTGEGSKTWYLTKCVDTTSSIVSGGTLNALYNGRQYSMPDVSDLVNTYADPSHKMMQILFSGN
jgi:hypothetical protein